MRIGIMVDSTCDLPQSFMAQNDIEILPISVRIDDDVFTDQRDPQAALDFYRDHLGKRGHEAETDSLSVEEIRDLFLSQLVLKYDCVFCLTLSSTRSPIHKHASAASFAILKDYRPVRQQAGMNSPFLMRVLDTRNLFAAQGVSAVEAVRMREAGASPGRIRERLEVLANHTYGYAVPRDLHYLRARTQKKGDRSVSLVSAVLGSALDVKPILQCYRGETRPVAKLRGFETAVQAMFIYTAERVRMGLLTRVVCLSYGGDLEELTTMPGYPELVQTCNEHRTTLYQCVMSITGMVNLGEGAITLGFACETHTPKF